MSARSILSIAALAVAVPLAVTGCVQPSPDDGSGSSAPTASATTSPTPEPDDTSDGLPTALPADCAALVATADPAQFGDAPLNDPAFVPHGPSGVVTPSAPPANADARQTMRAIHELWCLWADPAADITHLSVEVGHTDPIDGLNVMGGLQAGGYTCAEQHGGTVCAIVTPNSQFPVDDEFTYLLRDDVLILIDQTNFPTNGLMASIVEVIWP